MVELKPEDMGAAVNRALDPAGFAIIATGLEQCLSHPESSGSMDTAAMDKLFLSLA
jgi:DNA-binding FrmR family transcriptional regulator